MKPFKTSRSQGVPLKDSNSKPESKIICINLRKPDEEKESYNQKSLLMWSSPLVDPDDEICKNHKIYD